MKHPGTQTRLGWKETSSLLQTARNILVAAMAVGSLFAATPSQGQSSWGDNQPNGERESASTGIFTPGRNAFDGNLNTSWQLAPGSGSGWVERYWSSAQQLGGVTVSGSIPQGVTLQFSSLQNNAWVPIPGAVIKGPQNGSVALPFPGYLAPTTRLLASLQGNGADQVLLWEIVPSVNSNPIPYGKIVPQSYTFNQNEYITIKPSRLWNGIIDNPWFTPLWSVPWEVTNTVPADQPTSIFPPYFGNPPQDPEIIWQLDNAYAIQTLKVYFIQNYQSIEFQFWDGTKWSNPQTFGAGWSDPGSGWKRIDFPSPISTNKVRITFPGSWSRAAYIGQVEIWGQGWRGAKDQRLTIPPADTDGSYHFTVNAVPTRDQELEVTVAGQTASVLSGELNGTSFAANPTTWIGEDTVYRVPFSLTSFRLDAQFLKLANPGTLHSVVLKDGASYGQIPLGWPYNDGQMSGTETGPSQPVPSAKTNTWSFKVPFQLERLRVYTAAPSPGVFQTLNQGHTTSVSWTAQGQGWWEANLSGIQADHLTFESPVPITLDEVEVWGSPLSDTQVDMEIWWPQGPVVSPTADGNSVIGWMGDPSIQPLIGGYHPRQSGNLFWMPLSAMNMVPGQVAKMTATGVLGAAQWSGPLSLFWPGSTAPATLDQGTSLTSTTQGTFVISGKVGVSGDMVFVQGTAVPVTGNKFSTTVNLKDGFQIVDVEVWDHQKHLELAQFSKPVYKTVGQPILQFDLPAGDIYTQSSSLNLAGLVGNGLGLTLSINGSSVPLTGNAWNQTVALTGGTQKISFVLKDNASRETDQTISVFQVGSAPTAQIQFPVNGAYLAASGVSLQVTGSNPQYWWRLNGGSWTPAYTQTIDPAYSLADGFYSWGVSIQDREGNISAPATVSFCVDTKPPLPFAIGTNVSGWTNNNRPTITFATTDATSGIDHYEVAVDTGGFVVQSSPYQLPVLSDGVHAVYVKAVDRAGNTTIENVGVSVDATPPQTPTNLSAVPGQTEIDLTWTPSLENGVLASLPLNYLITRAPAWPDGVHTSQSPSYNDTGLTPGNSYSYTVMEVDVAGNISQATSSASTKVGQTDAPVTSDSGGTVQFKDVEISFVPQSLPSQVTSVTINTVPIETLNTPPSNPTVGPIYQFRVTTTIDGVTTQNQNASFATAVPVQITYDPTQIPAGLNEQNLKPYYYDGLWGRWIPVKNATVDPVNHQISFLTTHFTDFSVQATQATEQSIEDLRDTKFSPFATQIGQKAVSVSPQGGAVTTEFTELVLPGKNHFDLIIKRTYDSGIATVDATTGSTSTDGDYPWYMGQGWRLDFPWMKWNGSGLWIKGLDGQVISADQGTMTTVQNGDTVNATLEVHESNDIVFQAVFTPASQYTNSSSTSYQFSSGKLLYKDGREVDYDKQGRVTQIVDSSGINSIQFTYSGNQAASIIDSLGRTVTFVNQTVEIGTAAFTFISGIQLAAGTETLGGSGGPSGGNPIVFSYNTPGSRAGLQLLSERDVQGRVWSYGYSLQNILHQFQGAASNNYSDTVYALALVSGPGIGQTKVQYQHVPLLYSRSTFSNGSTANYSSQVDDLQAASLSVLGPSSNGSTVVLKSSNYSFLKSDQVDFSVPYNVPVIFLWWLIGEIPETRAFTNSSLLQQYYTTQSVERDYRGDQSVQGSYPEITQTTNYGYVVKSRSIPSMSGALMNSGETDYQVVPYPTDVKAVTVDGSVSVQTISWDTNFMRVTHTVTSRSSSNYQDSNAVNSAETDLAYDNWGNITKSVSTTRIGSGSTIRQSVLEQDSSFYNVSGVANTSSWPGSPSMTDASFPRDQHSLTATQQTIATGWTGTVPTSANQTVSSQFELFAYTALGQLASDQKYTGTGWASTSYSYDSHASSPSYGELIQTIGPTGQVTNISYDFTSHPNEYWVTTTKASVDLGAGNKTDLVTRSAFDLLMGTCSWSQDTRGYVAQQSYDALGRVTKIVEPSDGESQPLTANISAWLLSANRSPNPTTTIAYDDTALTSAVTNPTGLKTFYQFNALGQLIKIQKTGPAISPLEPAGPEIITSALIYGDGYNYAQPTQVIGPYSNMETDPNRNASSLVTNYSYDSSGRITSVQMPGAVNSKTVVYDDTHSTTTTTDETNHIELAVLDWKQRVLAKTVFPDASTTVTADTFYDGLGRNIAALDPNGNLSLTAYNAFGLVSKQIAPTRSVQGVQQTPEVDKNYYPDGSLLQSVEVALTSGEKVASVNYPDVNGVGWPLGVQTPVTTVVAQSASPSTASVTVNTVYDALGNKLQESSGYLGGTLVTKQWTYDSHGRILSSTDELGHTTAYTCDLVGNRTGVSDPLGNSIALLYDSFNRLVKATLPPVQSGQSNPVIQFRYDGHGNLVQRVEPDGMTHLYTYSLRNEVLTEAVTNGTTSYVTKHGYDDAGRQTSISSPSGHTVNTVFDGAGRVLKQGNDAQGWTSFTYDSNGNKKTVTDGNGNVAAYRSYTPENKPQSVIDGNGSQSFITYDRWGRQIQTQDGEQNYRTFQYDELGRMTGETTPTQGALSYIYDAWGDIIQKTDARGTVFSQTYDAARRMTNQSALNGTQSQFVNFAYDNDNNLMTSDNGSVATVFNTVNGVYQNNPYGLATQVTKTVGSATLSVGYSFDNRQRVTQITYPDQSQVGYSYNSLGQPSSMLGWIDNPISYDSYGRLQDLTLDNRVKRSLTYDSQDRLTGLNYTASGTEIGSYAFTYDQASNILTKAVDGNTANQYTYDKNNQLIGANEHGWFQQPAQSVQASYGTVDNDYKGTAILSFTVQPYDQVTLDTAARSVGVDLGSVVGISQIKLTPQNSVHRVRQRDLSVFVSNTNRPGDFTRVTGFKYVQNQDGVVVIQLADVVQARFIKVKTIWNDRDVNDIATDLYASFKNTASILFQVAVLKTTQNDAYTYDGNGNRISLNVDGNQQTLTYYKNVAGGDLSLLQSDGTWVYKYDPNGNMVLKAKAFVPGDNYNPGTGIWNTACDTTQEYWTYSWDLNNRLASVSHNGNQIVSYLYDVAGLRSQRTGRDGTTVYMYSSSGTLIYSNNTTTGLTRTVVYMGSTIVGWNDTTAGSGGSVSSRYYASTDHLGSVTKITDANAKVVWQSEYTPFGAVAGAQGIYNFTGLFTGKDVDVNTGLYYFNARWYDASTGRFISQDAAGQGLNWYSYGGNNPLSNTDPTGNDWGSFWSAVGVGVAAVAVAFIPVVGPYLSAAIIGGYMGGVAVNGGNLNIGNWKNDAQTWEGIGAGAVIGVASAFVGAAVLSSLGAAGSGAALSSTYALDTGLAGAASGFVGGFGNAWAFGDMKNGLFHGGLANDFEAGLVGGVAGFAAGYLVGALAHQNALEKLSIANYDKMQASGIKTFDPSTMNLSSQKGVIVLDSPGQVYNVDDHIAILVQDPDNNNLWEFYTKDGSDLTNTHITIDANSQSFQDAITDYNQTLSNSAEALSDSYSRGISITTTAGQNLNMIKALNANYLSPYNLWGDNCADLVRLGLSSGGIQTPSEFFLEFTEIQSPNQLYNYLAGTYQAINIADPYAIPH